MEFFTFLLHKEHLDLAGKPNKSKQKRIHSFHIRNFKAMLEFEPAKYKLQSISTKEKMGKIGHSFTSTLRGFRVLSSSADAFPVSGCGPNKYL